MSKEISVTKMTKEEAEAKFKISSWGTWGCEVKKFDWQYSGKETAYVLEGERKSFNRLHIASNRL